MSPGYFTAFNEVLVHKLRPLYIFKSKIIFFIIKNKKIKG
jgi:hypothetical protein